MGGAFLLLLLLLLCLQLERHFIILLYLKRQGHVFDYLGMHKLIKCIPLMQVTLDKSICQMHTSKCK